MPAKIPKTDDTGLNMTPMIDIVFQLILFFLFNLRFKSMEYRIESTLPKDRGLEATPQLVTPIPAIKVSLFRLNAENPGFQPDRLLSLQIFLPQARYQDPPSRRAFQEALLSRLERWSQPVVRLPPDRSVRPARSSARSPHPSRRRQ